LVIEGEEGSHRIDEVGPNKSSIKFEKGGGKNDGKEDLKCILPWYM
jgi:hypothetical protein